jgi:GNAT superfamily N-acetyltransferase
MPIHLNPLSKVPPSGATNHESDVYLLPAISTIHFYALLCTKLHQTLYPGPKSTHPGIIEANLQRNRKALLDDPEYQITTCVGCHDPEVGEEWNVVGFVKYLVKEGRRGNATAGKQVENGEGKGQEEPVGVPAPPPAEVPKLEEKRVWPEGTHTALVEHLWPKLLAVRQKYDKELQDYIFVDILGTDPAWQRQGVGKLLMEDEVCKVADQKGIPVWLEATQEGRGLYQKLGFVEKEKIWVDLGRWENGQDKGEGWRGEGKGEEGEGEGWYVLVIMVRDVRASNGV